MSKYIFYYYLLNLDLHQNNKERKNKPANGWMYTFSLSPSHVNILRE